MILLLTALTVAQVDVRFDAGIESTHRTGQFAYPLALESEEAGGFVTLFGYQTDLTPTLAVQLRSRRQRVLAAYEPRLFVRWQEGLESATNPALQDAGIFNDRPGVLHTGRLEYELEVAPEWVWLNAATLRAGESEIVLLNDPAALGGGANAVTGLEPFLEVIELRASSQLTAQFSPRHQSELEFRTEYFEAQAVAPPGGGEGGIGALSNLVFAGRARHTFTVDRRNEMLGELEFRTVQFPVGLDTPPNQVARASVGWAHQVTRSVQTELLAGALLAELPDSPASMAGAEADLSWEPYPFARATVILSRAPTGSFDWTAELGAILDGEVNLASLQFSPSAGVQGSLRVRYVDVEVSARAFFRTLVFRGPTAFPDPGAMDQFVNGDTLASGALRLDWIAAPRWRVFTELEAFASGFHLSADVPEVFPAVQVTGLLGLSYRWSTIPIRAQEERPDL